MTEQKYYDRVYDTDDFLCSWLSARQLDIDFLLRDVRQLSELRSVAEANDPAAQLAMFCVCLRNTSVGEAAEAWSWLESAADSGLPEAEYIRGKYLVDVAEGKRFLESAAKKGLVEAQFELAEESTENGLPKEAEAYLRLASAQGFGRAKLRLARIHEARGEQCDAFENYRESSELLAGYGTNSPCQKNSTIWEEYGEALYSLASCYIRGYGCEKSVKDAIAALLTVAKLDELVFDHRKVYQSQLTLMLMLFKEDFSRVISQTDREEILQVVSKSSILKQVVDVSGCLGVSAKEVIDKSWSLSEAEKIIPGAERNARLLEVYLTGFIDNLTLSKENDELNKRLMKKNVELGDMMAMFAHKFRGTVDSILFNAEHRMEPRLFADAARTMNGLLDIFSIVSTDPDKLIFSLSEDQTGTGSPERVLTHSLKLALFQLLSQRNRRRLRPHYLAYAKRSGMAPLNIKLSVWDGEEDWQDLENRLHVQWENEIGDFSAEARLPEIAEWMEEHLVPIKIDGFKQSDIRFAEYGPKASLLMVIFTEILVNAIKHSEPSASTPILVTWVESSDAAAIHCSNPSTRESRRREASKGSGRGHQFLRKIADDLRGNFTVELENQPSNVTFTIPLLAIRKGMA